MAIAIDNVNTVQGCTSLIYLLSVKVVALGYAPPFEW